MSTRDRSRQACRLGGQYIIDQARMVTEVLDQNFVTALIFLAILRANVGGITDDRDAASRHLGITETPSDDNRLPVSVYALARDLHLPYETVRRHVQKLKQSDLCVPLAAGVIVPTRLLAGSTARDAALAAQRACQAFVNEADRFGIIGRPAAISTTEDAPLQIARLATTYFVEGIALMTQVLDVDMVSALVLHTVGLLNTAPLRKDTRLGLEFGGLADIPPDELRAPVSVYAVSRYLRLPYETTRRTLHRLMETGLVRQHESGAMTIPTEVFERPHMVAGFERFGALTATFLDRLAEYGVTPRSAEDWSSRPGLAVARRQHAG